MKRHVKVSVVLLGAVATIVVVIATNVARMHQQVRGLEVEIYYGKTPQLVSQQAVADTITAQLPHLMRLQVRDVDLADIEQAAAHIKSIANIDATVSVSGKVVVRADQRRPIGRLFINGSECYFDRQGKLFPTSTQADCKTLVVNGTFGCPTPESLTDSTALPLQPVWHLARYIDEHPNCANLIDQVHRQQDGNLMLTAKIGPVIELGDTSQLDQKFASLFTFYHKGMPRAGWQSYSKISLKYHNQVVCTKWPQGAR
ncbi:MAG: hypothetical protein IJ761_03850 [Bacteroidales bacterium]|nr:hypothetical protein [Bacteroidales bacterium]